MTTGFSIPIWQIFVLSRGLTFTELFIVDAVFSTVIVLGETPTGYVSDRIGRRNSLVVSTVLIAVSVIGFGLSSTVVEFSVSFGLWGLGFTFRSGAESAWLYDILKTRDEEEEFARVNGRGTAVYSAVTAVTALSAGYLFSFNAFYPFLVNGLCMAAAVPVAFTFPAVEHQSSDDEESFSIGDATRLIHEKLLQPPLRWFVIYVALFTGLVAVLSVLVQPVTVEVGQIIGIPRERTLTLLGFLYSGFIAAGAIGGYFAGTIKNRIGIETWFRYVPFVFGVLLAGVVVVPFAVILLFFARRFVESATKPLKNQYISDRTPMIGRATVLSAVSMFASFVRLPVKLSTGVLADWFGPLATVAIIGTALAAGSAVLLTFTDVVGSSAADDIYEGDENVI